MLPTHLTAETDDPTETTAFDWLRALRVLLAAVVSLLTALELLGLL